MMSAELLEWPMQDADHLSKIITGYEFSVFSYKPETKRQFPKSHNHCCLANATLSYVCIVETHITQQ